MVLVVSGWLLPKLALGIVVYMPHSDCCPIIARYDVFAPLPSVGINYPEKTALRDLGIKLSTGIYP